MRGDVRFADSAAPGDLAVYDQGDARAGDVFLVEDILHRLLQSFERAGMRQAVRLLGAAAERQKQKRGGEKRSKEFGKLLTHRCSCAELPRGGVCILSGCDFSTSAKAAGTAWVRWTGGD